MVKAGVLHIQRPHLLLCKLHALFRALTVGFLNLPHLQAEHFQLSCLSLAVPEDSLESDNGIGDKGMGAVSIRDHASDCEVWTQ